MLERWFQLQAHGTTVAREAQAGLTTFAAMAYILAVNPSILATTGMDAGALVTVTAISAALSTLLMALLANYPIALAPGMGINAFFAYVIVGSMGVPWPEALGMVFLNGILFLLLSVTGARERIVNAIPYPLKLAITGGVGLFIAFIGLKNAGVIVAHPATLVTHGSFASAPVALCLGGLLLAGALFAWKVPGAIVLSIIALTGIGVFLPAGEGRTVTEFQGVFGLPHSIEPLFLALRFDFLSSAETLLKALPIVLTLLLVDLFDNVGTLIGVTKRAGLLRPDGTLPRAGRALLADSLATVAGATLGTSTVVSYIESTSGVEAGGRTGLTGVVTAGLLLLALFFTPLLLSVPAAATAPALVLVGVLMMQAVREIAWDDLATALPCFLVLIGTPLMFSIAEGIGLGLVAAGGLALLRGRPREFTLTGYILALVFFLKFFELPPF